MRGRFSRLRSASRCKPSQHFKRCAEAAPQPDGLPVRPARGRSPRQSATCEHHGRPLRPDRHRRRPRRLCRRDPRRAARPQDGLSSTNAPPRRHLPQRGLHSHQGDAPRLRAFDEAKHTASPRWASRSSLKLDLSTMLARKDEVVKGNYCRRRLPDEEEQDRHAPRHRQDPVRRQGRGDVQSPARRRYSKLVPLLSPPARTWRGCRAWTSTKRRSSRPPALWSCRRFPRR